MSMTEIFWGGERSMIGICMVNDWDCVWFGLGGLDVKVLTSSLVVAPLLGLCWPIDWLFSWGQCLGWLGSMIEGCWGQWLGFSCWEVSDLHMCGQ